MGLLRGVGKSLRWLVATGWGLAVLFCLWRLEAMGSLGPSLLHDPHREFDWIAPTPQHPEVVAISSPAGLAVVPLSKLGAELGDPRIVASINLVGDWRPHRPDRTTAVAWRQTSIHVLPRGELSQAQAASAVSQFISLQREWGNDRFVRGLDAGPGRVATRMVVRWDIIGAHLRAVLFPALFAISVLVNVTRSVAWIGQQLTRDAEREFLARDLCPTCRYDIAALPTPICPECGTDLDEARRQVANRAART